MQLLKQLITTNNGKLKSYIFKPVNFQILQYSEDEIFNLENKHLEYFPMVNQRVFPIGGQEKAANENEDTGGHKEILNIDFKRTYTRFIHLALHQNLGADSQLKLNTKHKLQLAYFLQLQDRIDEAMLVFKAIDISEIQQNENELACQVPYDYMKAYFDFFADDDGN